MLETMLFILKYAEDDRVLKMFWFNIIMLHGELYQ